MTKAHTWEVSGPSSHLHSSDDAKGLILFLDSLFGIKIRQRKKSGTQGSLIACCPSDWAYISAAPRVVSRLSCSSATREILL